MSLQTVSCFIHPVKTLSFEDSLSLQMSYVKSIQESNELSLHICAFQVTSPVITLGLRSQKNSQAELLWSKEKREKYQITILPVRRGGQATLHSPGQILIYPLLPIQRMNWGIKDFVFDILGATKKALLNNSIHSFLKEDSVGLYTPNGKIAFIGLGIEKGVSSHGLALNVSNDLNLFKSIIPCGTQNETFDQCSNYSLVKQQTLYEQWLEEFYCALSKRNFNFKIIKDF